MPKDNPEFNVMFAEIKVKVISSEKWAEILSKEVGSPVHPWGSVAIVINKKGDVGVFNNECIGTIETKEEEYPFEFDCYPVLEKGKMAIAPNRGIAMSADEVRKMSEVGEENNLKDFMGDRYSYNGRIQSNMWVFRNWYINGK